ncbi:MAG: glycosyltransferase [Leptolyngbya sp.]|nr:glycosyltransferase [Candidatus Melainabacteria bacterium]
MFLIAFLIVHTLIISTLLVLMTSFFATFRKVKRSTLADQNLPSVSVIIPVRNEEGKVRRCLESIAKQDYPNFEVIVIDDKSTDSSGAIIAEVAAANQNFKIVNGRESRPGWLGKCNALDHGYPSANGDWLIFTDADTYHHSNSIRDAISAAIEYKVDLISFMPVQELYSLGERVVMPALLSSFLVGDPNNSINDPSSPRAYAYGQYIGVKKTAYDSFGGHASVKDQILDDISIGKVAKSKGFAVTACDGRPLYTVRMYTSFPELWQGWTKNAFALINCDIKSLIAVILLLHICAVVPILSLILILTNLTYVSQITSVPLSLSLVAAQFILVAVWYFKGALFYKGLKFYDLLLLPAGAVLVSALYLNSAYCFLTGRQVKWKDRDYSVDTTQRVKNNVDEFETNSNREKQAL